MGEHTQSVSLQDVAGSVANTRTRFVVTTSFDDLAVVIDQYAARAADDAQRGVGGRRHRASAADAVRLPGRAEHRDRLRRQQETVTIAKALSPPRPSTRPSRRRRRRARRRSASRATRPATAAARTLRATTGRSPASRSCSTPAPTSRSSRSAPYHASAGGARAQRRAQRAAGEGPCRGHADEPVERHPERAAGERARRGVAVINPRPRISADVAAELKDLLAQAETAADVATRAARSPAQPLQCDGARAATPAEGRATERAALSSAAKALIDQVNGVPVDTSGTGVEVGPADDGDQAIRAFWNPSPLMANPRRRTRCSSTGEPVASVTSRSSTSRR